MKGKWGRIRQTVLCACVLAGLAGAPAARAEAPALTGLPEAGAAGVAPLPSDPRAAELLERMADRPPPPGATGARSGGEARNHDQGAGWLDGVFTQQYFTNCFTSTQGWVTAYTGYWGKTDGSYPRIGDRYYGHIVVGIAGNPCSGGEFPITEVTFPSGLGFNFGSDAGGRVRCWYTNTSNQTFEVTSDPDADCRLSGPGIYGQYNLGGRGLASYTIFEIIFPIRSNKKLIGAANGQHRMIAPVSTAISSPSVAYPFQWTWVFPPDPTTTRLNLGKTRRRINAGGSVSPNMAGRKVVVRLFRKVGRKFRQRASKTVRLNSRSRYSTSFGRPRRGRCRVTARFIGDTVSASSTAAKAIRC